jgi:hypothetical protein
MAETNAVNRGCLLLMAHGSKNANWLVPFQQLAEGLKKDLGDKCVQLCYMETWRLPHPHSKKWLDSFTQKAPGTCNCSHYSWRGVLIFVRTFRLN